MATPYASIAAPPTRCSDQSTANPKRVAGGVDDAPRGRDDLRPDAVARDRRDPVRREVALRHGRPSLGARRDERDRDAVDLGAVELVDRDEVGLERRLDDVRG